MTALQTPYQIDVTAKTATGGEVHLVRTIEAVAIPVFQFGIFSDVGPELLRRPELQLRRPRPHQRQPVAGRRATGATLTMTGKMHRGQGRHPAVPVERRLDRQRSTGPARSAWRPSPAAPIGNRNLLEDRGQRHRLPGSAPNAATGRRISLGATPGQLQRLPAQRPCAAPLRRHRREEAEPAAHRSRRRRHERATSSSSVRAARRGRRPAILYNERLFTKASLRILLSDTAADITNIPGVTPARRCSSTANWNVACRSPAMAGRASSGAVRSTRPPIALSPGPLMATRHGAAAGGDHHADRSAAPRSFRPTFSLTGGVPDRHHHLHRRRRRAGPPWRLTGCTGHSGRGRDSPSARSSPHCRRRRSTSGASAAD